MEKSFVSRKLHNKLTYETVRNANVTINFVNVQKCNFNDELLDGLIFNLLFIFLSHFFSDHIEHILCMNGKTPSYIRSKIVPQCRTSVYHIYSSSVADARLDH